MDHKVERLIRRDMCLRSAKCASNAFCVQCWCGFLSCWPASFHWPRQSEQFAGTAEPHVARSCGDAISRRICLATLHAWGFLMGHTGASDYWFAGLRGLVGNQSPARNYRVSCSLFKSGALSVQRKEQLAMPLHCFSFETTSHWGISFFALCQSFSWLPTRWSNNNPGLA